MQSAKVIIIQKKSEILTWKKGELEENDNSLDHQMITEMEAGP